MLRHVAVARVGVPRDAVAEERLCRRSFTRESLSVLRDSSTQTDLVPLQLQESCIEVRRRPVVVDQLT